jgi:hypothetical protein
MDYLEMVEIAFPDKRCSIEFGRNDDTYIITIRVDVYIMRHCIMLKDCLRFDKENYEFLIKKMIRDINEKIDSVQKLP